jgi:hypothetical protein
MNDPLIDAIHEHEPLNDPLEEVNLRLAIAATDIAELRAEIIRLDRDLDESRRLNRRAAELLDLVYEHLAGNSGRPAAAHGAGTSDGAGTLDGSGTLDRASTLNRAGTLDRAGTFNNPVAATGGQDPVLQGEGAGI